MARYENGVIVAHRALGHSSVAVAAVAVGLPDIPDGDIRRVVVRTLDGDINWRDDGVAPTAATGFLAYADEIVVFDGAHPEDIQLIRAAGSASNADVRVIYYGV